MMKKTVHFVLATLLIALWMPCRAVNHTFKDESLPYKVMFKWGLINKQAGDVTINLTSKGNKYYATLTAKSASWADHVYKVRDTLNGVMVKATLMPESYEKIAREDGEYKLDRVLFSKGEGNIVVGNCSRYVEKNGKVKRRETLRLEAEGTTVDMLSSFYYMRTLPFETMTPGHVTSVNIFSGKRKELLSIKYIGKERVEYDKKVFDCFHVSFIFTSDGKKKTSDDMDAWITTDGRRLPVRLEGKLPVGRVRCFYTGD